MTAKKKNRRWGQPAPRWPEFMAASVLRIAARGGFTSSADPVAQMAEEIVAAGEGEKFLKAVRRGRPTARQNLRYQLLREVERAIGASVPRRRDDRNTPDAVAIRPTVRHDGEWFSDRP